MSEDADGPFPGELRKPGFDVATFLERAGVGRRHLELAPGQTFFTQGDAAISVFYLQNGRAQVTVVSHAGKEATITLLSAGDFVGESALAVYSMNPSLRKRFIKKLTRPHKVHKSLLNVVLHDQLPGEVSSTQSRSNLRRTN